MVEASPQFFHAHAYYNCKIKADSSHAKGQDSMNSQGYWY